MLYPEDTTVRNYPNISYSNIPPVVALVSSDAHVILDTSDAC